MLSGWVEEVEKISPPSECVWMCESTELGLLRAILVHVQMSVSGLIMPESVHSDTRMFVCVYL